MFSTFENYMLLSFIIFYGPSKSVVPKIGGWLGVPFLNQIVSNEKLAMHEEYSHSFT